MSLPLKALFTIALLLLAGCGFSPMYGNYAGEKGLTATQGLDSVEIALIPDQSGVYVRNILIDGFYQNGYPASPAYVLEISKITETKLDLDITQDSEATRKQIRLQATAILKDKVTNEVLFTRNISSLTSYNVLGTQFTTRVSESDAREAGLADLARQIQRQTALYFKK